MRRSITIAKLLDSTGEGAYVKNGGPGGRPKQIFKDVLIRKIDFHLEYHTSDTVIFLVTTSRFTFLSDEVRAFAVCYICPLPTV